MPKTNDATGASYAGVTGVVEHAAPIDDGRKLSELDPERNLDGTLIEGAHPDREEEEPRTTPVSATDPQPIAETDPSPYADEEKSPEPQATEREEEKSPGTSSSASTPKTSKTSGKNDSADRSPARTTGSHS